MPKPRTRSARSTNRLASEKSPYLLQHQHNPVDWYPWGEEAFARARRENKPVFLSIGYSTCHWCHVMERESFEDESVAAFLNGHFVAIKVDREERPDVDKIYMTFVQAMTAQGGWPLSVFLTPELKPFYGGTYWPPETKHGRPGFLTVLQQVHQAWHVKRDQITASAADMHHRLAEVMGRQSLPAELAARAALQHAGSQFKQGYDPHHGGWGDAPKFPTPSLPGFLLRYGTQFQDPQAVAMVLHTAERMAHGGICDQLGGGFHRYSVDAQWVVPHFEKMLYDNAQLLGLYLDCYLVSGKESFAEVARGIIRYVLRDMTHPAGGFYSAEDADSEGKEGKYYCWTKAELSKLLTTEEFNVVVRYYGISATGNFIDHSDPQPLPDLNVLHVAEPNLASGDVALLGSAKEKLFQARSRRARPHVDDKILVSWNGLMLGNLARAAVVLNDQTARTAAERNLAFLRGALWDEGTKTLHHRWREGERDTVQLQTAYAFLLFGVLEMYQATLHPDQLAFAVAVAESMLERFFDAEAGGFWQSGSATEHLILRAKEDYDGAEPSGNSVAILGLLKLSAITGRTQFREAAERSLQLFADRLQQAPQAVPAMLLGLDLLLEEPKRVVLAGKPTHPAAPALLRAAHGVYQPNKVVLGTQGPVEEFALALPTADDEPIIYLCLGTACQPPTRDPRQVKEWLR